MYTISSTYCGEFESKKSRFLAFLTPFSSFHSLLFDLKKDHPKAVHFVYATRLQKLQIIESFSDDGEPKGSSGIPTLNVLRGESLIDVGLISVRYFGGTLLGVGGLVRAYTHVAQEAIKQAKKNNDFFIYQSCVKYSLRVPYSLLSQVEHLLSEFKIQALEKKFGIQEVKLLLSATQENKEEFQKVCKAKFGFK